VNENGPAKQFRRPLTATEVQAEENHRQQKAQAKSFQGSWASPTDRIQVSKSGFFARRRRIGKTTHFTRFSSDGIEQNENRCKLQTHRVLYHAAEQIGLE